MLQHTPHPTRLPLTAAQRGIWFAQRLAPANPCYSVAEYVDINGSLDVDVLRSALRRALAEAQCLHVRCGEDDTGPWQRVKAAEPEDIPVAVVDLSTAEDPQAAAERLVHEDLATVIDMESDPLFTEVIFVLGKDRHLWYQRFHHLAMDGFSHALITQRVASLYSDFASGRTPTPATFGGLHELVQDDADYQAGPEAETDQAFWRTTMSGIEQAASLSERDAPLAHTHLIETHHLPHTDFTRLRTAARALRSNWSGLLIAALAAYTHRVTGATDIVVGLPVTARKTAVARRTPGMMSNVVPLRLTVSPSMTLRELVAHAVDRARPALRQQRHRYEDIRRDLGLRHEGGGAVCGPHLNIRPFDYTLRFGAAHGTPHTLSVGPVEDLTIGVSPHGGGLNLEVHANPDRYTPTELAGHLTRYLTVLNTLTKNPDHTVGDLDILDPAERRQLLSWARSGGSTQIEDTTLPEAFQTLAHRFPERPAVTYEGKTLSYGEVNTRANRLAHHLKAAGAGPHHHVALALPRSPDILIALLAVLKTGAAYIPIDPDYPPDRINHILRDAQPHLLITTRTSATRLPDSGPTRVLLDAPTTHAALTTHPPHDMQDRERTAPLTQEHPAYVIYTSGSTGTPKGVLVTHRNVMSLLSSTRHLFDFGPTDVWSLFHSYAFDFSVWEIWGALLHGGRLVIVPTQTTRSPQALLSLLTAEGVTVLNQTPSAFYQFMQAEQDDPILASQLALRYVVFGGEALDLARLAPWYKRHTDEAPCLVNMYGITETTVHTTHLPLTAQLVADNPGSIIGTALPNTEVYVLDTALNPVPAGITGELHIAGLQVTPGYLHRPELTQQRYLPHPFDPRGTRLYRTGDLARWLPGGLLEYRGRVDDQVKVRGFRIELGEIEAALKALPDVTDARALAWTDAVGDTALRAYVIPAPGTHLDPNALRATLRNTLPAHMVPAAIVIMDSFPLTAHGKLDRTALPAPTRTPAQPRDPQPRDPLERRIAAVWSRVFPDMAPVDIGSDDDFFDLGGDSFKAVRAARDIGDHVSAIDIFKHPTPRRLATHLRATTKNDAPERWLHTLTPARAQPPRLSLICIPYGGGSATAFQPLATHLPPHVELRAAAIPGHDPALPEQTPVTLREAAKRLAEEVTHTVKGPLALYGHCVGTALALLTARELENSGAALQTVHLAAALPDPDPHRSLAELETRDDDRLYTYLRSLGGFDGALEDRDLRSVLQQTRHAMVQGAFFQIESANQWEKLQAPVHVIIGDADAATTGYQDGYLRWGRYARHISLSVLPNAGHYFVKDHPKCLAELLTTNRRGQS